MARDSEIPGMYDFNENGYVVILSEHALITMVLASLEAYAVRKLGSVIHQQQLEVYGSLYGQQIEMDDGRTLYRVELASHDTTSRQRSDSVHFNEDAIVLKNDALASFWPHLDYLGDFHSHPFGDLEEAQKNQGYFFSETDREGLDDDWDFWKDLNYRLGLVVTVAPMQRARAKSSCWLDERSRQCMVLTLGNFRIWIAAYCVYEDEAGNPFYTQDRDRGVELFAPSVTGLVEHVAFGRFKDGEFYR